MPLGSSSSPARSPRASFHPPNLVYRNAEAKFATGEVMPPLHNRAHASERELSPNCNSCDCGQARQAMEIGRCSLSLRVNAAPRQKIRAPTRGRTGAAQSGAKCSHGISFWPATVSRPVLVHGGASPMIRLIRISPE
jgi:hypothetical protein